MGTFIHEFEHKPLRLEDKPKFLEQAERLMRAGGLLTLSQQVVFDYKFNLLDWPHYVDWENWRGEKRRFMTADYSWFEHNWWEYLNVYTDRPKGDPYVCSGKVGWRQFARAALALHLLEGLYSDYTKWASLPDLGTDEVYRSLRWIYTILEDVPEKPFLSYWLLYEQFNQTDNQISSEYEASLWKAAVTIPGKYFESALDYWQAEAVENGIEKTLIKADEMYDKDRKEGYIYLTDLLHAMNDGLDTIFDDKDHDENEIFEAVMMVSRFFCDVASQPKDSAYRPAPVDDQYKEALTRSINLVVDIAGDKGFAPTFYPDGYALPVFVLAKSCERTGRDFWDEYEKNPWIKAYFLQKTLEETKEIQKQPLSTAEFFRIDPDQMLIFWNKDNPLSLSRGMEDWLANLNLRYQELVRELTENPQEKPLRKICSILSEVQKTDPRAIPLMSFYEESLDHINEPAWIAYWILFEELGRSYKEDHPERQDEFSLTRNRDYRLEDYLAVMANPELRDYVFSKERIETPKD